MNCASWMTLVLIMHCNIFSLFSDDFAYSTIVYIQVVFIDKCSFHFGCWFMWVVMFNNENTLLTCKLTHLEKSIFCCKMFVAMIMYEMIEVFLIRKQTCEYILSCCFCFNFLRRISFELLAYTFEHFFVSHFFFHGC